jgi:uncharacterized protein (DUF1330 family)
MAVDPRGADLKRYLAEDPGGPVVMLNLLRYRPDGGRARYADYLAHFQRTSAPHGAEVLYVGEGSTAVVAEDGQAWDAVLLVRYPNRDVFAGLVRSPEYRAFEHLREEALADAVMQPTHWLM